MFKIGDRVTHKYFGAGTIKQIAKINIQPYLVQFDNENTALHNGSLRGKPYKNNTCWYCKEDELKLIQFTKSDLQNDDIVTYRNGDKNVACMCLGDTYSDMTDIENKDYDIVKVERPTNLITVYERKEEILDEKEKEYLRAVIAPFRSRIKFISRNDYCNEKQSYIRIDFKNGEGWDFPEFDRGTMYRGMEEGREYTLEELDL